MIRKIWALCIVQCAEFPDAAVKRLTLSVILRYNNSNQKLLHQKAEDMSNESAHLTERMLTR